MTYVVDTSTAEHSAVDNTSRELSATLAEDSLYEVLSTTNAYLRQGASILVTLLPKADLLDGETIVVRHGTDTKTYELDVSGNGVARGSRNIQVDISGEVAVAEVADKFAVAVAAAQPLLLVTHNHAAQAIADKTFTAAGAVLTNNAHGMLTGDGPVQVSTDGVLPAGLTAVTDYWVVRLGANTFSLATSRANAYAGTVVTTTDAGTGTHTLADTGSTTRSAGTVTLASTGAYLEVTDTVADTDFTIGVAAVLTASGADDNVVCAAGVPRIISGAGGQCVSITRVTADGAATIARIHKR